jgi:hypothetical protein
MTSVIPCGHHGHTSAENNLVCQGKFGRATSGYCIENMMNQN